MQIAFRITGVFRPAGYGIVKSYCIHASVVRMLQEFLYDNMLVRQMHVCRHTYCLCLCVCVCVSVKLHLISQMSN